MFATSFRLPLVAGSGAGESFLMASFFSRPFLFLNGLLFFGRPFSRCGPCLFLSFDGFFQDLFLPEAPPLEDSIFLEFPCFFYDPPARVNKVKLNDDDNLVKFCSSIPKLEGGDSFEVCNKSDNKHSRI